MTRWSGVLHIKHFIYKTPSRVTSEKTPTAAFPLLPRETSVPIQTPPHTSHAEGRQALDPQRTDSTSAP